MNCIKYCIGLTLLSVLCLNASAQIIIKNKLGKGILLIAEDSSFSVKISTRVQSRYDGILTIPDDPNVSSREFSDRMRVRRARIKFSGFVFNPKIKYKFEYDMVKGEVLDALLMWNFAGNFSLWAGQTKLPGNRERVISSQKLQFVDRSLLNSEYNLDRDDGIQLRHHFNVGKMLIREISCLSMGEGKNYSKFNPKSGYDWTQRIEILPMGEFTKGGDYVSGDVQREDNLKIAIGATYDYNDNSLREQGQRGDELLQMRDITSLFFDLMVKYKGLSFMAEYADRSTTETAAYWDFDGTSLVFETFRTGSAINLQLGYLLKSNWEFATRFTQVTPEDITLNPNVSAYTLGVSKYIVGHTLKFQTDVSYIQTEGSDDQMEFRIQFELGI